MQMIREPTRTASINFRSVAVAACLAAIVHASFSTANACAIPVHRYLLERWEREFYVAYYFYSGEEDKADREVNAFLEDTASSFGSHVNLAFRAAEISEITGDAVALGDREVWSEHRSEKLPFHLLLSPRGTLLFRGRLDLPTAKAIVGSPMRTRIARELCQGNHGLLLLLSGADDKENERAENDVRWVLARAKKEHGLDVAFLRLSRNDPKEKWLVHSLLSLVGEPPENKECVVFGVCGRGRVLTGCLGEGITRRNVIECIGVMNGDCSCDLRFANPGMDLLTDWDWDAAIASLPPVTEEMLSSLFLGFDDSEENSQESSPPKVQGGPEEMRQSGLRGRTLALWGAAFGIGSAVVIGIGLILIRKRKEM